MKKKILLTTLAALPVLLLTACNSDPVYGRTFKYAGALNSLDSAISESSQKTMRTLVTENFDNIKWDEVEGIGKHGTAQEAINSVVELGNNYCKTEYNTVQVVFGKKGENKAHITWKTESADFTFTPEESEMLFDFKDSKGNQAYGLRITHQVNGKVDRAYMTYTNVLGYTKTMGTSVNLPLLKKIEIEGKSYDQIGVDFLANFTNY